MALDDDPRNVESLVNLALVRRVRRANRRSSRAAAASSHGRIRGIPGSHYNLAVVADESGNAGLAISHYRTFLKLGAVSYPDLASRVRTRLMALEAV